ncbi:MAG: hypothetical protein U9N48_00315 [Euryarchaeota archaeon]|nr:hypothetical protein [Euryarchaeota archaeon]
MRLTWGLISVLILVGLSLAASSQEEFQEDYLGITDLGIVDVHHSQEYMRIISGYDYYDYSEPFSIWGPAAGSWSLTLQDSTTRYADLVLYQVDGEVFGQGTMIHNGRAQTVAAGGSMMGNLLDIRLITLDGGNMYRLRLDMSTRPARGSYSAYSPAGARWAGTVTGERCLPTPGMDMDRAAPKAAGYIW